MEIDKKTVTVIVASTAIGYLGDVLTYSLGQPGKFKLTFPKGKEALQLLGLGLVSGLVIDYTVKKIEQSLQTEGEKKLQALLEIEKKRLAAGERKNQEPVAIVWNNLFPA
jgi:hypothetical protein